MKEQQKKKVQFRNIHELPVKITDWIGSSTSLAVHTFFFLGIFTLKLFGVATNDIMLILTTAVSLEAIYLSIFIQMTVNRNTQSLEEVEENIDELQEDIEGMEKDIDEIQVDIDEIQEDEEEEATRDARTAEALDTIGKRLQGLLEDLEKLKKR